MGRIEKYPLERMKDKSIFLSFKCPQCRGALIEMSSQDDLDFWKGVECPKCHSLVILDNLSVAVVRDAIRKGKQMQRPWSR